MEVLRSIAPPYKLKDYLVLIHGNCEDAVYDNTPQDSISRYFLPGMLVWALLMIYRTRGIPSRQEDLWRQECGGRLIILDQMRIACVWCVVMQHTTGGDTYAEHNVGFVLAWVMPYLHVVSGISFMFSKIGTVEYLFRFLCIFVVGVTLNWLGRAYKDGNIYVHWQLVIFQMNYCLAVGIVAFLSGPIRQVIVHKKNEMPRGILLGKVWMLIYACGCAVGVVAIVFGVTGPEQGGDPHLEAVRNWPSITLQLCGLYLIGMLGTMLESNGWIGWIMMAYIYIPRIFVPYTSVGVAHNWDIFVVSMIVYQNGLRGSTWMRTWFSNYWPVNFVILCGMSLPNVEGRCDLIPMQFWWMRVRFYFQEFWLLWAFLSGALNGHDPWKQTKWATDFSLYTFMTHVCVLEVFGTMLGWFVVLTSMNLFWLPHHYRQGTKSWLQHLVEILIRRPLSFPPARANQTMPMDVLPVSIGSSALEADTASSPDVESASVNDESAPMRKRV